MPRGQNFLPTFIQLTRKKEKWEKKESEDKDYEKSDAETMGEKHQAVKACWIIKVFLSFLHVPRSFFYLRFCGLINNQWTKEK